jgi:hypothetical protein
LSNFFGGLASRGTGAMSAVIWMEWVGVLPTLAVAGLTTGTRSLVMVADGMSIGVIGGAGLVCHYRAMSVGAMADRRTVWEWARKGTNKITRYTGRAAAAGHEGAKAVSRHCAAPSNMPARTLVTYTGFLY